ncbi:MULTISPECIES: cellulose synthase complex periplasmic endoglucanase BcsZ [Aeromonas]|uniref:cellulose synthase complex periplasmic endoglucanase BcsZ n=1 Tax=Aeromonas TaxID=642 RepID=UPI0022DF4747|nr:cellulose synthase complex periplasmic endoglucanase BcsZ [Aeromonas sp. QDB07]
MVRSIFCGLLLLASLPVAAAGQCNAPWQLWELYARQWVQTDGRVLESSLEKNHSSSEGQSYALFFSLVANDQQRFANIWRWSRENLAGNDPSTVLPAWHWGQGKDGQWKAQDSNSASDADLWFAYALLEADRLWNKPAYREDGLALLAQIKGREVKSLPGLGYVLLPGPFGFEYPGYLWRLNPSYQPVFMMRRLAAIDPDGPWNAIAKQTPGMILGNGKHGFAADWIGYRAVSETSGVFTSAPLGGDFSSYDAIRVYLWAGMTDPRDPLFKPVLNNLQGMSRVIAAKGMPPEKANVLTGETEGYSMIGFSAAVVPFLHALDQPWLADLQYKRAREAFDKWQAGTATAPVYYDYMLSLFGLGWADGSYRFALDGRLQPYWEKPCTDIVR